MDSGAFRVTCHAPRCTQPRWQELDQKRHRLAWCLSSRVQSRRGEALEDAGLMGAAYAAGGGEQSDSEQAEGLKRV